MELNAPLGTGKLLPGTKPVKLKTGKFLRASKRPKPATKQPNPPPCEDTEDGLQFDLEQAVKATIASLYLFRVLLTNHRLYEIRRIHPFTEYHLAELCTDLVIRLSMAENQIEARRQRSAGQKRKGGQGE